MEEDLDLQAIDELLADGVDPGAPLEAIDGAAPPPPAGEARQTAVVSLPRGALRIALGRSRGHARIKARPAAARDVTFETILHQLGKAGVTHGLLEDAVFDLLDLLASSTEEEVAVKVAEAEPAVAGRPLEVVLCAEQDKAFDATALAHLQAASARVRACLDPQAIDLSGLDGDCHLPLVQPGDLLLLTPPSAGIPGHDVCGGVVTVEPVDDELPEAGPGIEPGSSVAELQVAEAGYLTYDGDRFEILCPVIVDADRMQARLLCLAPPQALDVDVLHDLLREAGIQPLPETADLAARLCEADDAAPVVVEGTPAVEGRPGRVEYEVELGSRAGSIREDGGIDFADCNFTVGVTDQQLLARVWPPVAGVDGLDVWGAVLPAAETEAPGVEAGDGVETRTGGDVELELVAARPGSVFLAAGVIEVRQVLQIDGDIDYHTGSIQTEGDIVVGGDVRAGFSAEASGDIVVVGGVENAARLQAGGAITIGKGITGEQTRVRAGVRVGAQFVQDARVDCDGDIEVGSYSYNADLRGGASVVVHGRG